MGTPGPRPTAESGALTLVTCSECPNAALLRRRLNDALLALDRKPLYAIVDVNALPPTDRRLAFPAPTLLWRGRDLFGLAERIAPYPPPT